MPAGVRDEGCSNHESCEHLAQRADLETGGAKPISGCDQLRQILFLHLSDKELQLMLQKYFREILNNAAFSGGPTYATDACRNWKAFTETSKLWQKMTMSRISR